jgi:hypothetical protein
MFLLPEIIVIRSGSIFCLTENILIVENKMEVPDGFIPFTEDEFQRVNGMYNLLEMASVKAEQEWLMIPGTTPPPSSAL